MRMFYEEGTGEYERTHIDPTALNYVFDIINRLQRGKGSLVRSMIGMTRLVRRTGAL